MKRRPEIIRVVHDHPVTFIQYDQAAIDHNRKVSAHRRIILAIALIVIYTCTIGLAVLGIATAIHYGEGAAAFKLLLAEIVWHVIQTIIAKVIWDAT